MSHTGWKMNHCWSTRLFLENGQWKNLWLTCDSPPVQEAHQNTHIWLVVIGRWVSWTAEEAPWKHKNKTLNELYSKPEALLTCDATPALPFPVHLRTPALYIRLLVSLHNLRPPNQRHQGNKRKEESHKQLAGSEPRPSAISYKVPCQMPYLSICSFSWMPNRSLIFGYLV